MPRYVAVTASFAFCALALVTSKSAAQETAFASVPSSGEQVVIGQSVIAVGGVTDTQFSAVGLTLSFGDPSIVLPASVDAPFTLGSGETLGSTITDSFDQLIKVGSGTAVLAAPNAFENGVVIQAGRLRVERADYLSFNTVENAGEIEFFASDALPKVSFVGTILGSGSLLKTGAGDVRLERPASSFYAVSALYSGETRIEAGTLEIGGNFNAAQSTLVIADGAGLHFEETSAAAFGAINGHGTISAQRASGVTTLQFGTNGTDGDFSGSISGPIRLEKTGANTQILRGQNNFL